MGVICNEKRFAYAVANECNLQWLKVCLINSYLASFNFIFPSVVFLLAIFYDKVIANRYGKQGLLPPGQSRIHGSGTTFETGSYMLFL